MSSEVATLRRQIALECAAMQQALSGYAAVARHTIINQRYQQQLRCHVGVQEAQRITVEAYEQALSAPMTASTHDDE